MVNTLKKEELSREFIVSVGKYLTILEAEAPVNKETISKTIEYLQQKDFKPYKKALIRSRHRNGYNYKLSFVKDLLDFVGANITFKANNFKYNYTDNMVAEEFGLERSYFLYIKNKYMRTYQILCDAYACRAFEKRTEYVFLKRLEVKNASQEIFQEAATAIYSSGESHTGYAGIANKLKEYGLEGYKTRNSFTRSFSSDNGKIKHIEDIMLVFGLEYKINAKNSDDSVKKMRTFEKKDIEKYLFEFYKIGMSELKGIRVKSLGLREKDIALIVSEAICYRLELKK